MEKKVGFNGKKWFYLTCDDKKRHIQEILGLQRWRIKCTIALATKAAITITLKALLDHFNIINIAWTFGNAYNTYIHNLSFNLIIKDHLETL